MKKILLITSLMTLATQSWASGLIECKFESDVIYKMSLLLNEGSNGLTIELKDEQNPSFTYIDGRDAEVVSLNPIGDTEQLLLQASNKGSHGSQGASVTAIFPPVFERRTTVELFITKYGKTQYFEGRCFVVAGY